MDQMLHHIILQITPASAVMIRGTEPKDIEVLFLNIKLPWQQLADENILRFNVVFDEFWIKWTCWEYQGHWLTTDIVIMRLLWWKPCVNKLNVCLSILYAIYGIRRTSINLLQPPQSTGH